MIRFLFLLLLPVPALAEGDPAAPWRTAWETCVEAAAGDPAALERCRGQAAEPCMDGTPASYTTNGMAGCALMERDLWDAELNRLWAPLRERMRAADAEEAPPFDDRADALLAAQRTWIAHRDAECRLDAAIWGAGTLRTVSAAGCQMDMTAERVIRLRALDRSQP